MCRQLDLPKDRFKDFETLKNPNGVRLYVQTIVSHRKIMEFFSTYAPISKNVNIRIYAERKGRM